MTLEQLTQETEAELETVEKPTLEFDDTSVVLNATEIKEATQEVSDGMNIVDFTAPQSGINHGHSPDKHDARNVYNIRDEFVDEVFSEFGITPNDHAALWLLSYRKDEFIAHDEPIFSDTHDTDESRWASIESRKLQAPISSETQQLLRP